MGSRAVRGPAGPLSRIDRCASRLLRSTACKDRQKYKSLDVSGQIIYVSTFLIGGVIYFWKALGKWKI
jgi:hypothetical protein